MVSHHQMEILRACMYSRSLPIVCRWMEKTKCVRNDPNKIDACVYILANYIMVGTVLASIVEDTIVYRTINKKNYNFIIMLSTVIY